MGRPMLLCSHKQPTTANERGQRMATDHPSKTAWERENTIKVTVKINRNQDPELYNLFAEEGGSRSALAKDLMRKGAQIEGN